MKQSLQIFKSPKASVLTKIWSYVKKKLKKKHQNDVHLKKYTIHDKLKRHSETVYIFGNGPSINSIDLDSFAGEDVFVCNHFNQHDKFTHLYSKNNLVYFMADKLKSYEKIASKFHLSDNEVWKIYLNDKFSTEYPTVLPYDVGELAKAKFPTCQIHSFDYRMLKREIQQIYIDKTGGDNTELIDLAAQIRHTPNLMIQTAIIMGYRKIYLFGLDHSYVRDRFNGINFQPHFYDDYNSSVQKVVATEYRDLTELLLDSHLTFKVYKAQNELAKTLNIEIYDCTINGCLDMFKKINF